MLNVEELSDEELKRNLITNDYKGQEYKAACLQELIDRAVDETLAQRSM